MRALGSSYIRLLNESNCIKSCEKRRFWLLIVSLVPPIIVQCAFAIRTLTLGKKTFIVHGSSWESIISRHGIGMLILLWNQPCGMHWFVKSDS